MGTQGYADRVCGRYTNTQGPEEIDELARRFAVADPASELTTERRQADDVQHALAITPDQIVAVSYSDELLRVGANDQPAHWH